MSNLESRFNASALLRIGHKSIIKSCWDSKTLSFGCAANWVHYYATKGNAITGDPCECVFARIPKGKKFEPCDKNGVRIEDNLQRFPDEKDQNFEFVRYVPTMLTPTICFYSLLHANEDDGFCSWDKAQNVQTFYADKYAKYMGYSNDEMGIILIQDLRELFDELEWQVPIAIAKNTFNLTQGRYYLPVSSKEYLFANIINYSKHQRFEIFEEEPVSPEELFWKFPEYVKQAELRIVIPHWNFVQSYNPFRPKEYDEKKNYLPIQLPQLHSYASLYIPSEQRLEGRFWNQ